MPKKKIVLRDQELLLYGGMVKINLFEYEGGGHDYKVMVRDKEVDALGVTNVLNVLAKPALVPWAVKLAVDHLEGKKSPTPDDYKKARVLWTEERDKSADSGRAVHDWIERYIKTGESKLPNDSNLLNGIMAFLKWAKEHSVEFIHSERTVYSLEHQYVGTLDAVASIDGKICVVDFKTGSSIYLSHALQTAAYREAVEEENQAQMNGPNTIIRLDKKTGEFHVAQFPKQEKDLEAFLSLLKMKRREEEAKKEKYIPAKKYVRKKP